MFVMETALEILNRLGPAPVSIAAGALGPSRPHYHCGPFNPVKDAWSGGTDDICHRHDIHYGELSKGGVGDQLRTYLMFNDADQNMIDELSDKSGAMESIYSGVFKAKKALTPKWSPLMDSPQSQGHPVNVKQQLMVGRKTQARSGVLAPGRPRGPRTTQLTRNAVRKVAQPAASSYVNHSSNYSVGNQRLRGEEPVLTTWAVNTVEVIFVNPGDAETWPLLALEAKYRMRYMFHKLGLTYRPSVPTTTTGEVGIGWVSDPNTPAPSTLSEILSLGVHAVGPAWAPLHIELPKELLRQGRRNYLISQTADAEPTLHAPGYFVMFSEVANSGRLMCPFEVELDGRNPYPLNLDVRADLVPLHGARMFDTTLNLIGTGAQVDVPDRVGATASTKSPYLKVLSNGTQDSIYALRPCCIRATYHFHFDNNNAGSAERLYIETRYKENGGAWANLTPLDEHDIIYNIYLDSQTFENVGTTTYLPLLSTYTYPVELGFSFQGSADTQLDGYGVTYEIVEVS